MKLIPLLFLIQTLFLSASVCAQGDAGIESVAMAVEQMIDEQGTKSIEAFIDRYMAAAPDRQALVKQLQHIREELKGIRDGVGLDMDEEGAILSFMSPGVEKRLRIAYDAKTQRIQRLAILPPEEKLVFSRDRIDEAVQFMLDHGMSGLLYLKAPGGVLEERPFGMANKTLSVPNSSETIFAIGSRPIDFTVAAILLLDQQGELSLDDPIAQHVDGVPTDKQSMTIRHLMTGASGLPDFFDQPQDWDPDLQWISREEAVKRMMQRPLLFEPGHGNAHSHGAFGLLAAIVERKSGLSYMQFLEMHFFKPARMARTGEYGDRKDLEIVDFAEGGGPQRVGLPNIPPNWGPTSWLVKGSGGMYSTLGDLQSFYALVRHGGILDAQHAEWFLNPTADVDGSMRGFELFSVYLSPERQLYLFLNNPGKEPIRRKVFRALEELLQ